MNILVLNGSPKGKNSVTCQTPIYLEKRNPQHNFTYLNVAQQIKTIERNFSSTKTAIESADMVICVYPVYTFLIPYQLLRLFEVMDIENVNFSGKIVTQISTSKHFFDTTAHKFLEENLLDRGGRYIAGLSADMEDLLTEKGRRQADCWFDKLIFDSEIGRYAVREKVVAKESKKVFQTTGESAKTTGNKRVLVVTSCGTEDENLKNMIAEFVAQCPHPVEIQNVREFSFSGGCLGCMQCSVTGNCIYRDGFEDYLRNDILTAEATIYAFTIENHYAHSSFKCFDDRQFCNGHRTVSHGMPVGYIISGNYKEESNLQVLVEGRSEVGGLYLSGVATDEGDTAEELKKLALSVDYTLTHQMDKPSNFYGVGGTKIFRDMVYLMQGMMKADHKFYKKNGIYDFPQNQKGKIFQMKLIGALLSNPKAQKKMKGKLSGYILMPYEKVIAGAEPKATERKG